MKKKNIKFIIFSIIILIAILMGITAHTLNKKEDLNFFEKAIKDSVTFVEKIFYSLKVLCLLI